MTNRQSILVTGASGQLGQSIQSIATQYPQFQFSFASRGQLDLASSASVADFFKEQRFDAIINCAAYTAVDKAEQETVLADLLNHKAVKQLAEIAKQNDTLLIHISTDYVFSGNTCKPYSESDETQPMSVYGDSKLNGEKAIIASGCKALIIRTAWLYSEFGQNFMKTMLRLGQEREQLAIIFDQIGTPTYAVDLAGAILEMLNKKRVQNVSDNKAQIYHYSNEGVASWYDFAKAIFTLSDIDCKLEPIETKDYPTPAERPQYSLLNKQKIKHDFQLHIPYWRDSLAVCLQNNKK